MDKRTIRIGVDVGGTNTDICAIDEKTGELMVYKLPSSLYDQSAAVVEGVKVIAEQYGFEGEDVSRFMHGTTVATNAILEGRGAKTALITPAASAICWRSAVRSAPICTTCRPTRHVRWSPVTSALKLASA